MLLPSFRVILPTRSFLFKVQEWLWESVLDKIILTGNSSSTSKLLINEEQIVSYFDVFITSVHYFKNFKRSANVLPMSQPM